MESWSFSLCTLTWLKKFLKSFWFYKCYIAMCNNSERKMVRRVGKPVVWSSHEGPVELLWNFETASKLLLFVLGASKTQLLLFLLGAGGRSCFFCHLSVSHPFSFRSLCTFSPFSPFFFFIFPPICLSMFVVFTASFLWGCILFYFFKHILDYHKCYLKLSEVRQNCHMPM